MGDPTAALCHLLTRAHFAGVPTTRMLWSHVSYAIDAAKEELSPEDMIFRVLEACVQHPLSIVAPRDPKHDSSVLKWLGQAWESRGWVLPKALTSLKELREPQYCPELCYKTYVGWGGGGGSGMGKNSGGVTLLESCGGIVHHTTGLTTWGGAAVLAEWVANTQEVIAGRRVLELGAGVGFTASVILTSLSDDTVPPVSYTATDCHHHVLTLLHHNLELNLREEPMKREDLEAFQEVTGKLLVTEEAEVGQMLPWKPESKELRLSSKSSSLSDNNKSLGCLTKAGTKVEVLQVDWRQPPVLPDVDVILASDVVYAHHLIPPLVALIKSVLDGSASRTTQKKASSHRKTQRSKTNDKAKESTKNREEDQLNPSESEINRENSAHPKQNSKTPTAEEENENNEDKRTSSEVLKERVAYIACTRRTHETMNLFLEEVTKQGLCHSLVYQATLDTETFLFLYNETHLPVKIYKLALPSNDPGGEE